MIEFVPGQGWVHSGDGGSHYVIGGEMDQAQTQNYLGKQQEFRDQYYFDPSKDYTGTFSSYFGAIDPMGMYAPSFAAGPNQSWQAALSDRLKARESGTMGGVGDYESRIQTADPNYRASLITRNNAIEDMYRRGYDGSQISAYLGGDSGALAAGPSFQSYFDALDAGKTDFANQYFIGSPGYTGQAPAAQNTGPLGFEVGGRQQTTYSRALPSGGPNQQSQMGAFPSKGGNTPSYGIPTKGGYNTGDRMQFGTGKGGMQ